MIINKFEPNKTPMKNVDVEYGDKMTLSDGWGTSQVTLKGISKSNEYVVPGQSKIELSTPSGGADTIGAVTVEGVKTEELIVNASEQEQVFTPSAPSVGFSKVTVKAAPRTSLFVSPAEYTHVYTPNSGDYAIGSCLVKSAQLQTKTITPSSVIQTIKPDSGYYGMNKVTVKGGTSLRMYSNVFRGGDTSTYYDHNVSSDMFITNPEFISIYCLDDNNDGTYGAIANMSLYSNSGMAYFYSEDKEAIDYESFTISDLSYFAYNEKYMTFGLPKYWGNDRLVFASGSTYCVTIMGT